MSAKTQKKKTSSANPRARGRVLLLTEEPTLPNLFTPTGLEVVGVATGTAAVVSLQRSRPHLVVAHSDIKGISLREIARLLTQTNEGLPLIVVGTDAATAIRRKAMIAEGAIDYFQLPEEGELVLLRAAQAVQLQQTMERLKAEADLDSLTGLANRRRFRTALSREVERWRRYSVPCALLLLDIDHMKAINDRYGHPTGDVVIRHVANVLTEVSRDNDTAARLGGEEFALLLSNISAEKAALAAERLRVALAARPLQDVGAISVSIGVAACPAHADTERALYAASDRALYVAKNEGRNRVAVAPLIQENLPGV